jgi:hypothetical protein
MDGQQNGGIQNGGIEEISLDFWANIEIRAMVVSRSCHTGNWKLKNEKDMIKSTLVHMWK